MDINKIKKFLITEVREVVKNYYGSRNPELYEAWQGNCCRQIAVNVANMLKDSLDEKDFTPSAFEGQFNDFLNGKRVSYNHCWVFLKNNKNKKESVFIDIARSHKPNIVMFKKNWKYPKDLIGYGDQQMIAVQRIDFEQEILSNEYYTEEPGYFGYKDICHIINDRSTILN